MRTVTWVCSPTLSRMCSHEGEGQRWQLCLLYTMFIFVVLTANFVKIPLPTNADVKIVHSDCRFRELTLCLLWRQVALCVLWETPARPGKSSMQLWIWTTATLRQVLQSLLPLNNFAILKSCCHMHLPLPLPPSESDNTDCKGGKLHEHQCP